MKKSELKKEIKRLQASIKQFEYQADGLQDQIDEFEHEEIVQRELNKGVLRVYKESNAVFTELDDTDPTGQKFVGLYLNEASIYKLIEILDYTEEEEEYFNNITKEEGHEPETHIWYAIRHLMRLLISPTIISE